MATTRLGLEGYGVRRASSFADKGAPTGSSDGGGRRYMGLKIGIRLCSLLPFLLAIPI